MQVLMSSPREAHLYAVTQAHGYQLFSKLIMGGCQGAIVPLKHHTAPTV
jgi:hypothetical protein